MGDCRLARGALVTVGAVPTPEVAELLVVAGPLPPTRVAAVGPVVVGRGAGCTLRLDHTSVAPAHALFEPGAEGWRVCPLSPAHPTRLDGEAVSATTRLTPGAVVGVGAVDLQLVEPDIPDRVPAPTAPVHRSAPARCTERPDPGPEPTAPAPAPAPSPPGVLSLLLPVAAGGVLAVAIHPTAGLFTAATPVLAVGAHLDARRRWRRDRRREDLDHETERATHRRAREINERSRAAGRRLRYPSPGDALTRARLGIDLWPVRVADRSTARLGVGWTDDGTLAPVTVTVDDGRHLGIAGPPPWAEAVARAVVIQALTRCGPQDRSLRGEPHWPFLRWLPHRDGDGAPLVLWPGREGAGTGVGIEVTDRPEQLTDRCQAVLVHTDDGAHLVEPTGDRAILAVRPLVADDLQAQRWARALARWTDPGPGGRDLPDRVDLSMLLTTPDDGPVDHGRAALRAPLGLGADGVLSVDLVADGPHALVAGTTGSGKSELLRTWVAGLAHRYPPTAVAFVLVDYKGGSAFDACARLPHVAGVVTDLDAGLGERLLIGLRAEVHEREASLRTAGVGDLRDLSGGPPRLVVVVDEFATLATELPDFLGALVDVARRGRSLGLHLVLATQRPAGAVNDDIRANTALRLCLRTLDPADSQDVIGGPEAAALPARLPGRAWVRTDEHLRLLQVADSAGDVRAAAAGVAVRRVGEPWPDRRGRGTELERLVADAVEAWGDRPSPAPVWRPPLPERLTVTIAERAGPVTLGREDRPAERRQPDLRWEPAHGHLVVLGGRGRGRTTALRTALLGLAAGRSPVALHAYVVDGHGPLADLADLPHVGAVVPARDRPTVRRMLQRLEARLGADDAHGARPLTVVVIDGYEALATSIDDLDGLRLLDGIDRLARDGPRHGIVLALSSNRPSLLPPSLSATTEVLVVLGLDDPADYGFLGLRPPARPEPAGRGHTAAGHAIQIGVLDLTPTQVAGRHGGSSAGPGPSTVDPLPHRVGLQGLPTSPGLITVGLRDRDLGVATVELRADGPFVVTGPPRSGRTTTLALLRAQTPHRPATHHGPGDDPAALLRAVREWVRHPTPHLFVVDDAELVDDPEGDLRALVACRHPDALVVVAVRADAWRSAYGTWLAELRPTARGVALGPDPVHDAGSWTVALPSIGPNPPPGRGVLVTDGVAEVIQVARLDA